MHAVRLATADKTVTVASTSASITDWCARYVHPWWETVDLPRDDVLAGPLVMADNEPGQYAALAAAVAHSPHRTVAYAGVPLRITRHYDTGVITAVSPTNATAYRSDPASGHVTVYGCDTTRAATAAARLAREVMRGQLRRSGWTVMYASAAAKDRRVVLALGNKHAGKTTTALTLATATAGSCSPTTTSSSAPTTPEAYGSCPGRPRPPWASGCSTPSAGTTSPPPTAPPPAKSCTPHRASAWPTPSPPAGARPS